MEQSKNDKRKKNVPFEIDKDCCSNEGRGNGESNWVKYQGEPLEVKKISGYCLKNEYQGEPIEVEQGGIGTCPSTSSSLSSSRQPLKMSSP